MSKEEVSPFNFYDDGEDYFVNYGSDIDGAFSEAPPTEAYYTCQLDAELNKATNDINFDVVYSLIRGGVDLNHRDSKGLSFSERAGLRMRYDIVDLLARARYEDL